MANDVVDKDSVLASIKKLIGPALDDVFDIDIIIHINMAFAVLYQVGFGGGELVTIEDDTFLWSDIEEPNQAAMSMAKTYVYAKVKMVFDPPASSTVAESLNRYIAEIESRINYECDVPTN